MKTSLAPACAVLFSLMGALVAQSSDLHLRTGTFDPVRGEPPIPANLRAADDTNLWVVQFGAHPTEDDRTRLRSLGGRILSYLPHDAYVVHLPRRGSDRAGELPGVRFVGAYHPAYRLDPAPIARARRSGDDRERYNIVVTDRHRDKPALIGALRAIGAAVNHEHPGSILVEASLTPDQLVRAARLDQVLWIDRAGNPEPDMDNARIQGGGQYVEQVGGLSGQGIRGHIYEGLEATHVDFTLTPIPVLSCNTPARHGHCTAGIIAGNGTSDPAARGMAPDAQLFFTNYDCVKAGVSRWQVVQQLVSQHRVMFTSASWGNTRTVLYSSISAAADDIVFSHDIPWTQSQSNSGTQASRPEAWAKNVISVGGVWHWDNADAGDDSWLGRSSQASHGPAQDGRIKPDLCAYYDSIHTSDLTGSAGYAPGSSFTGFSGTSGATPIVAGHNAIALQMYTDGVFGNALRVPGGTRFDNRPHFTTLKALQIANARQYFFYGGSVDNRREHQGWGFPDLRSMWDNRGAHVIVDETDVLRQGEGTRWSVDVAPGRAELKICMTFADPPGNPASLLARVNDLTLRVTSPNGETYWGNAGLEQGNHSLTGGSPNTIDTVENVFVASPTAGRWSVDVMADLVAMDGHVETAEVDADYALVINGASLAGRETMVFGSYDTYGAGCAGTAPGPGPRCMILNQGLPFLSSASSSWGFAVEVIPSGPGTMTGFELHLSSPQAATIATAVFADAGGLPGAVLATGTMQVGTTPAWYPTTLATPVSVVPGQPIHIAYHGGGQRMGISMVQAGTRVNYSFTGPTSSFTNPIASWTGGFQAPWAYRIHCDAGPLTPALFSTEPEPPRLGLVHDLRLAGALANTAVVLTVGASDSVWRGGSLPFSLAPIGAPGCRMLTSLDVLLAGVTDPQGMARFPLAVPGHPSLLGQTTHHQAWVLDPAANVLGVVTSNGVHLTVGH